MTRKDRIARSVTNAILHPDEGKPRRSRLRRIQRSLRALITLHGIGLHQHHPEQFSNLRQKWDVDSAAYTFSFEPPENETTALNTTGDLGYSGSTFFITNDARYIVKSVPRHFEFSFFRDDFLQPYNDHMTEDIKSMLIRITDFLEVDDEYRFSPGILFGLAPSHHIVMENLLVGKEEGEKRGQLLSRRAWQNHTNARLNSGSAEESDNKLWKWETWDLKPTTYFFPERDIAQGRLTSEATQSRLADEFNGKLHLIKEQAEDWESQLNKDTKLLQEANAVDYSLFLIRIPVPESEESVDGTQVNQDPFTDTAHPQRDTTSGPDIALTAPTPSAPPFTPPDPPSWRTGVPSADGMYVYRAAVLDFFWAKHKSQPKVMTGLVNFWNKIDPSGDNGPMSITTNSTEYRERFMKMCMDFVEVHE